LGRKFDLKLELENQFRSVVKKYLTADVKKIVLEQASDFMDG